MNDSADNPHRSTLGNGSETTLELRVSIAEANMILESLGSLPFSRVYTLIAKLQEQASRQIEQVDGGVDHGSAAESAARG